MALTYSVRKKVIAGNSREHYVDITIGVAGDYSSGIAPTAAGLGFPPGISPDVIVPFGQSIVGVTWWQDTGAGNKLRASKGNGVAVFVEAAGADVAGSVVRVRAVATVNG